MNDLTTEQIILAVATLAGGFISAGWGSYISNVRQRGGLEGFWMGLTLGPFGVIAAACMPFGEPVAEVKPSSLSQSRDADDDAKMARYTDAEWARRTPGKARKPSAN